MPNSTVSAIRALPEFTTPNKPPTPHNGWAPERPWQCGRTDPVARQLFFEPELPRFANMVPHDQNNGHGHRNK
jgi:hypothetical protein